MHIQLSALVGEAAASRRGNEDYCSGMVDVAHLCYEAACPSASSRLAAPLPQVTSTNETVGTFAIAYAAHKALSPVRFPPTVALTPVVARWLGKEPKPVAGEATTGGEDNGASSNGASSNGSSSHGGK
jgi:hypothetical protein